MKRRKWLLLLPLLGILLLLCGCEDSNAVALYIDALPENARASVQLCDREGQWQDAAEAQDVSVHFIPFSDQRAGWGAFEDTFGCDARVELVPAETVQDPVRTVCETYPECRLLLTDSEGGVLQTSDTIPLILPDKFACVKRIIYNADDKTAQTESILPRRFWGRTVSEWLIVLFCAAIIGIPVMLIFLLVCDVQKHRCGFLTASVLLCVPEVMFCVLYFLQRFLPYLNLHDAPPEPKDFLCLLTAVPDAVLLFLLIRRLRSSGDQNQS